MTATRARVDRLRRRWKALQIQALECEVTTLAAALGMSCEELVAEVERLLQEEQLPDPDQLAAGLGYPSWDAFLAGDPAVRRASEHRHCGHPEHRWSRVPIRNRSSP